MVDAKSMKLGNIEENERHLCPAIDKYRIEKKEMNNTSQLLTVSMVSVEGFFIVFQVNYFLKSLFNDMKGLVHFNLLGSFCLKTFLGQQISDTLNRYLNYLMYRYIVFSNVTPHFIFSEFLLQFSCNKIHLNSVDPPH